MYKFPFICVQYNIHVYKCTYVYICEIYTVCICVHIHIFDICLKVSFFKNVFVRICIQLLYQKFRKTVTYT